MKTIEIQDHYTPEGNPTCAKNYQNNGFCKFLMSENFGLKQMCYFDMENPLTRDKDGNG